MFVHVPGADDACKGRRLRTRSAIIRMRQSAAYATTRGDKATCRHGSTTLTKSTRPSAHCQSQRLLYLTHQRQNVHASAGKLAEDVLSSVLHATAPPAGGAAEASGSANPLSPAEPSPGVARPVPRLLERAPRSPDFDDLRGAASATGARGPLTLAAGKRDATWMVRNRLDRLAFGFRASVESHGGGIMHTGAEILRIAASNSDDGSMRV